MTTQEQETYRFCFKEEKISEKNCSLHFFIAYYIFNSDNDERDKVYFSFLTPSTRRLNLSRRISVPSKH